MADGNIYPPFGNGNAISIIESLLRKGLIGEFIGKDGKLRYYATKYPLQKQLKRKRNPLEDETYCASCSASISKDRCWRCGYEQSLEEKILKELRHCKEKVEY